MHFASRLGLDLQSVRGIPEKKQMSATDTTAKLKQVDVARLAQLEALVASLTARLTEAEAIICTLIEDVERLEARDNVTRDSVTSVTGVTSSVTSGVTESVTERDGEKRRKAAERQRRRREKLKDG